jgi:hypothetical protein
VRIRRASIAAASLVWLAASIYGATVAPAGPAGADDQAQLRVLQQQVENLGKELAVMKKAQGMAGQQQAMQRHWALMQEHMRTLRQMPGFGSAGGGKATMMGQGPMMGPGMTAPGMMGSGMMGSGMAGSGMMMGHGMGAGEPGWAMPSGVTPKAYQQSMQAHMRGMQARMATIAAQTDPAKRRALMQQHYEAMYRDMQTMRGMGWMWQPDAAASLPDPDSEGAKLLSQYCSQCHAAPSPSLHERQEWSAVIGRMRGHIADTTAAAGSGIKVPGRKQLDVIDDYLEHHARALQAPSEEQGK